MCRRARLCGSKRGPPRHQQYMATRRWWLSGCCIETTREMAAWLIEAEGGLATLCHASLQHAGLPAEASDKPLPQHWATPGSADVTTRTNRIEDSARWIPGGYHRSSEGLESGKAKGSAVVHGQHFLGLRITRPSLSFVVERGAPVRERWSRVLQNLRTDHPVWSRLLTDH
jgi:hypothetical protein